MNQNAKGAADAKNREIDALERIANALEVLSHNFSVYLVKMSGSSNHTVPAAEMARREAEELVQQEAQVADETEDAVEETEEDEDTTENG